MPFRHVKLGATCAEEGIWHVWRVRMDVRVYSMRHWRAKVNSGGRWLAVWGLIGPDNILINKVD